jgi:hypothetical protein
MKSYFGILGGEELIYHHPSQEKSGNSGMEIFGRDALVLGAGTKKDNTWTSYIQLLSQDTTNSIKFNTKIPKGDDKAASCTLNLSSLSATEKAEANANASLYSTNQDGKQTGLFINSDGMADLYYTDPKDNKNGVFIGPYNVKSAKKDTHVKLQTHNEQGEMTGISINGKGDIIFHLLGKPILSMTTDSIEFTSYYHNQDWNGPVTFQKTPPTSFCCG